MVVYLTEVGTGVGFKIQFKTDLLGRKLVCKAGVYNDEYEIKVEASFHISLLEQKGNSIFYNNGYIELFSELIRSNGALILIFETMVL